MKKKILFFGINISIGFCCFSQQATILLDKSNKILGQKVNFSKGNLSWEAKNKLSCFKKADNSVSLAFISGLGGNGTNVFIIDAPPNSSITQETDLNNVTEVSYSPDGKQIVFVDSSAGTSKIYFSNVTNPSGYALIDNSSVSSSNPKFSSDGKSIFYVKREINEGGDGEFKIWNYNISSGTKTIYTTGCSFDIMHSGKALIITRINTKTQKGELYLFDLTGATGIKLIAHDDKIGFSNPSVSPDDKTIVMEGEYSYTKGKKTMKKLIIYSINISSDQPMLPQKAFSYTDNTDDVDEICPSWSDNTTIYFLSGKAGSYEIKSATLVRH